ncbi:hypothetical protein HYC85_002209 [Camellia sinensis]|uniref:D-isomer specific 2-hydroxyacid dehydrogenase catalytic domain-containing protein n=1 Tax=Camellia sinensis TaxID=4442 RepID=A0A7J7I7K3_CAMSI|nr:hypothetical protein HYC85_002209 [Camellia sinensis]
MAKKIRYSCDSNSFASEGYGSRMLSWNGQISSIIILRLFLTGILIAGLTFLLIIGAAGGRNVSARGKAFSNMVVGYNNVNVNAATKYGVAVGNTLVMLPSGKAVADLQPEFDEIQQCPRRGLIIIALAKEKDLGLTFLAASFVQNWGLMRSNFKNGTIVRLVVEKDPRRYTNGGEDG